VGYDASPTPVEVFKIDASGLTLQGNIASGSIDIGGTDVNSWHMDSAGNQWWGNAGSYSQAGVNGDPYISSSGSVKLNTGSFNGNVLATKITGGQITGSTFRTAATGAHIRINATTMGFYSATNTNRLDFSYASGRVKISTNVSSATGARYRS